MKQKLLLGAAIAALFALWLSFFSDSELPETTARDIVPSDPVQASESRDPVMPLEKPTASSVFTAEAETQTVSEQTTDLISIGDYIDPERGADLSQPSAVIQLGEYIDPDRGADYSEPSNPIYIGDYIDPDRDAVLEVDPLEVLSIGAFIDPDSLSVTSSQETIEVGEYVDPDRD